MKIDNTMTISLLTSQKSALEIANGLMIRDWGIHTNQAGFDFCESKLAKVLTKEDYVCPFERPVNGLVKPLLCELYIKMNLSIIDSIERKIKELEKDAEQLGR